MPTFKEALCLLAIVIAYGVTGHMDHEDALRLEQAAPQRAGAGCVVPPQADDHPPQAGRADPPQGGRPFEGTRPDESCARSTRSAPSAPPARSATFVPPTRH